MNFFQKLLSFLYVPRCAGCRTPLSVNEGALCHSCRLDFFREMEEECPSCGLAARKCTCAPKTLENDGIKSIYKLFLYHAKESELITNQAIYRLKHKGDPAICEFFAEELAARLKAEFDMDPARHLITYAPRTKGAIRREGFDHMKLLAALLAKKLSIECVDAVDNFGKREQKRLSRKERFANTADAYRAKPGVDLHGRRVILIDDITTSGATLLHLVRALRKVGGRGVTVAVLGATPYYPRIRKKKRRY